MVVIAEGDRPLSCEWSREANSERTGLIVRFIRTIGNRYGMNTNKSNLLKKRVL